MWLHSALHVLCLLCGLPRAWARAAADLYADVVLSGGITMFAGINDLVTEEITALAAPERYWW